MDLEPRLEREGSEDWEKQSESEEGRRRPLGEAEQQTGRREGCGQSRLLYWGPRQREEDVLVGEGAGWTGHGDAGTGVRALTLLRRGESGITSRRQDFILFFCKRVEQLKSKPVLFSNNIVQTTHASTSVI